MAVRRVFLSMSLGSSDRDQCRKLGIRPGSRIGLDAAPAGWRLQDPPPGLAFLDPSEPADVVLAFFGAAAELPERLPALVRRIRPSGRLWVLWPRRAAGHKSDVTDAIVRAVALELGVVDVKVAAVDDDWSGLCFVWRLASRGVG